MEGIQNNDDLYFYAVMVSVNADGSVRKGPFYTLSGIKQAEGWRFPDDLDDYFGLHIPYRSAEFPVDVIAKTVDGRVIDRPDVTFEKGKFEIGETINHEFPAVIEDNGKTYTIVRSYISPKQDPSRKTWVQENPETNEKVRIRSFTVALGGTNLIAEYSEKNTVKAIYMTEGGQVLKEVDKGEHATGDEVNHTFEATLTKDGQTYEIIRSYITNNNKPDEKLFIQEKGDSKMLDRSIFVGSGGSNFIGIYKGGNGDTDDETEPGAVKENEVMNPDASAVIRRILAVRNASTCFKASQHRRVSMFKRMPKHICTETNLRKSKGRRRTRLPLAEHTRCAGRNTFPVPLTAKAIRPECLFHARIRKP